MTVLLFLFNWFNLNLHFQQEPIVNLSSKKLQFSAHGQGAKGPHNYAFSIDFFSTIVPEVSI